MELSGLGMAFQVGGWALGLLVLAVGTITFLAGFLAGIGYAQAERKSQAGSAGRNGPIL